MNFIYCKVTSSTMVYYNSFGQASNFPFINSLKILQWTTNRDSLLLATLQYRPFNLHLYFWKKSRSVSNLRKISGPAHLDFFFSLSTGFFQVYGINLAFFPRLKGRMYHVIYQFGTKTRFLAYCASQRSKFSMLKTDHAATC